MKCFKIRKDRNTFIISFRMDLLNRTIISKIINGLSSIRMRSSVISFLIDRSIKEVSRLVNSLEI